MVDELMDMKSHTMIPASLARGGIVKPLIQTVHVTYRDIHGFDNEWEFRIPDAIAAGVVTNAVLEPPIKYPVDEPEPEELEIIVLCEGENELDR